MAQIKSEWEIVGEAEKMVKDLCNLYPDKLGHIDSNRIGCAAIANKEQPATQEYDAKLVGVGEPTSLFCSKQYIISFYKQTWDAYSQAQKSMMVMKQLLRIPEEVDGAVLKEDLKDVRCLVKAFGMDYMDSPTLPDLTAGKYSF